MALTFLEQTLSPSAPCLSMWLGSPTTPNSILSPWALLTLASDLRHGSHGSALLTNMNVHGAGPVLPVAVGGAAEVRAGVADLRLADLDRPKGKSRYLW